MGLPSQEATAPEMKRVTVLRKSQDETLISNCGESQVERIDRWPINRIWLITVFEAKKLPPNPLFE